MHERINLFNFITPASDCIYEMNEKKICENCYTENLFNFYCFMTVIKQQNGFAKYLVQLKIVPLLFDCNLIKVKQTPHNSS